MAKNTPKMMGLFVFIRKKEVSLQTWVAICLTQISRVAISINFYMPTCLHVYQFLVKPRVTRRRVSVSAPWCIYRSCDFLKDSGRSQNVENLQLIKNLIPRRPADEANMEMTN